MSPLGKTLVSAFAAETSSHAVDGLGSQTQQKGAFACFSKGHFSHFVPRRQGFIRDHSVYTYQCPQCERYMLTHVYLPTTAFPCDECKGKLAEIAVKAQEEHAKARVRRMDEQTLENEGDLHLFLKRGRQ